MAVTVGGDMPIFDSGIPPAQALLLEEMSKNEHFRNVICQCWEIYRAKGNDYTEGAGEADRLKNFYDAAQDAGVTALQAWMVYMSKHMKAVRRYVKEGRVESEPIESRTHDVINYCILLLLLIQEEEEKKRK